MQLKTKGGYDMFEMSSLLQKAIRRGDVKHAAFAARELYYSYYNYMWKRLLVVSAEDCYGIMTKEIIALKAADDIVNAKRKKGEERDEIFVSKAITLLCMARKNRDACYVACNLFTPWNTCDEDEIPEVKDFMSLSVDHIPDWTYDCHTYKGKRKGKDGFDMVTGEQQALFPAQEGIFDEGDWGEWASNMWAGSNAGRKHEKWAADKKSTQQCIDDYFG